MHIIKYQLWNQPKMNYNSMRPKSAESQKRDELLLAGKGCFLVPSCQIQLFAKKSQMQHNKVITSIEASYNHYKLKQFQCPKSQTTHPQPRLRPQSAQDAPQESITLGELLFKSGPYNSILIIKMFFPVELLRLLFGMALLVPLSYALRYLKPAFKYWYSLIVGSALQIYVFRWDMYPVYIQHFIVFAIIKLKGPRCGLIVTVESMLFLSGYQIHEILTNYGGWTMNVSALLMILVCNYSLLAYNLEDGSIQDSKKVEALNPDQKRYRIISGELAFADFIGYCSFLPSALIGPPLEYQDYKHFMANEEVYGSIPTVGVNKVLLETIGETFLCAAIFLFGETYYPVATMRSADFYEVHGFWYVLLYVFLAVCLARFRYHCGWKLSMCAIHASGVSYNGKDFSRINTVNILQVETSIHVRQKINNWNIQVQKWLNRCIYQRHDFKSKTKNQLFVFLISAFWHGFYGAYYVSFVLWFTQLYLQGLIFNHSKNSHSKIVKLYKKTGKVGTFVLSFMVQFFFTENAAFFLILDGACCLKLVLKLYFAPQIAMIGLIVIFNAIREPSKGKVRQSERIEGESAKKLS